MWGYFEPSASVHASHSAPPLWSVWQSEQPPQWSLKNGIDSKHVHELQNLRARWRRKKRAGGAPIIQSERRAGMCVCRRREGCT